MTAGSRIFTALRPIALIGGTIALMGIVVGLYFQILPENILAIRYGEMMFFSLCIPFLLRDAWLSLNEARYSMKQLVAGEARRPSFSSWRWARCTWTARHCLYSFWWS